MSLNLAIVRVSRTLGNNVVSRRRFLSVLKDFEHDAQMTKVNDKTFTINFNNGWSLGEMLNGGYLMSVALKAAQNVANMDPLSFTGYYMNKGIGNEEATFNVEVLNTSKTTTTLQVSMSQLGLLRTQFLGVFGNMDAFQGLSHKAMSCPDLLPVDQCIDGSILSRTVMGIAATIAQRINIRLHPDSPYVKGFLSQQPYPEASLECWIGLEDGCIPDLRAFSLFSDSVFPCVLNLTGNFAWVPTLEYGVHFWAKPNFENGIGVYDGRYYVRARYHTNYMTNGTLYTDGELWSADGKTLLATSRQLARLLIPRK